MVEYSNSEFAKMLKLLQSSQKAIQSLSMWCLKHHEHYKSIIIIWLNAIREVKIERRLSLFYLANHVLQYSKKKNYKFVDKWKTPIQEAIPYVRHGQIKYQILRMINIWEERGVYDVSYLADLTGLLTTPIQQLKLTNPVKKVQINAIKGKICSCAQLEQINDSKMKSLTEATLPFTDKETIQNMLKDQTLTHELFKNKMFKIESYIKREIIDHDQLTKAIEVVKSCYEKQNREMKIVAQEYFKYTEKVQLLNSKLESLVDSKPIENPIPLPHINVPSPPTSSASTADLNTHNINDNTVLKSDKYTMNSSTINTINDTDIARLTTAINYIKSNTTPDKYATVQKPYDPAFVNFPATENLDQQSLTSQFPYDAPSLPPDETLTYFAFPNQTKMNNNNKSSTSSYEAYEHTPMSSSHQFITPKFSINMVPPTNLSASINKSTMPASRVPQTACGVTQLSDWTTNDTPAPSLLNETISYQNTHIINKTDGEPEIDHCILPSKIIDRDETINETSSIAHKNLNSSTHPSDMNSLTRFVDVDCKAFRGIPIPHSPPNLSIEAVSSPLNDNLEIVDMDTSDDDVKHNVVSVDVNLSNDDVKFKSHHDQKHPGLLPPPLPPMPFYQPNVPDGTHQWEQNQRFSNFVHNHPHSPWPQHVQRPQTKEDFRPKWERGINTYSSRDPRNFISRSRPTGTGNQGPRIELKSQPLQVKSFKLDLE